MTTAGFSENKVNICNNKVQKNGFLLAKFIFTCVLCMLDHVRKAIKMRINPVQINQQNNNRQKNNQAFGAFTVRASEAAIKVFDGDEIALDRLVILAKRAAKNQTVHIDNVSANSLIVYTKVKVHSKLQLKDEQNHLHRIYYIIFLQKYARQSK